jgi:hypothetical protein
MYNLTLGDILRKKANTLRNKTKLAQTLIDLATKGESESTRLAAAKLILETVDGRPATKPTPKSAADNKLTVTFEDAANRPS